MSTRSGRFISKVALFSVVLALSLSVSFAGTIEGSSSTARAESDTAIGQVMIFNGDFFNNGVTVQTFALFNSHGTGTSWVTPILFEETASGQFTVRAIGTSDLVTNGIGLQSFAFNAQAGNPTTTSGNYTFGFIEAQVNAAGTQTISSTGGVDLTHIFEAGTGVSGVGTNDWIFTPTPGSGSVNVALGQTFNIPGVGAGVFPLNASTRGGFDSDRTYSANLNTISAGVPEPGTLTLFTSGAGLLLAGLLRFRRRS